MRIAIAQINPLVGAIDRNSSMIAGALAKGVQDRADVVLTPELALVGYTPEDMLLRTDFQKAVERALDKLAGVAPEVTAIVGTPLWEEGKCLNAAAVFQGGKMTGSYAKGSLPNYGVFDDQRYFVPRCHPFVFELGGHRVGIAICEDLWSPDVVARAEKCDILLSLNGSPYEYGKHSDRLEVIGRLARNRQCTVVYCNLTGGHDEVVFDGASFVINHHGRLCLQMPRFISDQQLYCHPSEDSAVLPEEGVATIYQALVCGIRDYVHKNGFTDVLLGLSGGVDSALCLCLCVDALGSESVHPVMLSYTYTSDLSVELAREQCALLKVPLTELSIKPPVTAVEEVLTNAIVSDQSLRPITRQNIQARVRGTVLMALSNQHNHLLIATGNKSEMAVGYATLYGDMCGAYAPLKDVLKTQVYALARYCNQARTRIPQKVIGRAPSAELAVGQKDSDTLPEYDVLDPMIRRFVEQPSGVVEADISVRIAANEHKRRQSPPGAKISSRAFGRDRRYPITQGFYVHDQSTA